MDAEAIEQLLCGLEHTTVRERTRAQLELTKLRPAAIAPNATTIAAAIAKRLEHELRSVRVAALQLMHSKLRSDALAAHAGAVARLLNDTDAYVQRLALQTLRKVDASALAPHSEAMMERLVEIGGDDWSMRMSALKAMLRLSPDAITPHAPTIAEWLGTDVDVYVQCLAMRVLGAHHHMAFIRPAYSSVLCALLGPVRAQSPAARLACYWQACSIQTSALRTKTRSARAWRRRITTSCAPPRQRRSGSSRSLSSMASMLVMTMKPRSRPEVAASRPRGETTRLLGQSIC